MQTVPNRAGGFTEPSWGISGGSVVTSDANGTEALQTPFGSVNQRPHSIRFVPGRWHVLYTYRI